MKAGENVPTIAVKSGDHTENERFFEFSSLKEQSLYFFIFLR